MKIIFDPIEDSYVRKMFPEFFQKDSIFFEIISNLIPIGFYGVKTISDKVCEISVYILNEFRQKINKSIALKCLSFPFLLGFNKILIRTELEKMYIFLKKMSKYKVNYLFKHNEIHLFEVLL